MGTIAVFQAEMKAFRAESAQHQAELSREIALIQRNIIGATGGFTAIVIAAMGLMLGLMQW